MHFEWCQFLVRVSCLTVFWTALASSLLFVTSSSITDRMSLVLLQKAIKWMIFLQGWKCGFTLKWDSALIALWGFGINIWILSSVLTIRISLGLLLLVFFFFFSQLRYQLELYGLCKLHLHSVLSSSVIFASQARTLSISFHLYVSYSVNENKQKYCHKSHEKKFFTLHAMVLNSQNINNIGVYQVCGRYSCLTIESHFLSIESRSHDKSHLYHCLVVFHIRRR